MAAVQCLRASRANMRVNGLSFGDRYVPTYGAYVSNLRFCFTTDLSRDAGGNPVDEIERNEIDGVLGTPMWQSISLAYLDSA